MTSTDMEAGLALFLLAVGLIIAMLPVAECSECPHCARQRLDFMDRFCPQHRKPKSLCRDKHRDD